jgi:hypothetical protein
VKKNKVAYAITIWLYLIRNVMFQKVTPLKISWAKFFKGQILPEHKTPSREERKKKRKMAALLMKRNIIPISRARGTAQVELFIPELVSNLHKGSCGRVAVLGGSVEYTGAPFYAATSALK